MTPLSAARLAAEAAFAAPRTEPAAAPDTLVIVRKARLATSEDRPAPSTPDTPLPEAVMAKPPRVFTIDSPPRIAPVAGMQPQLADTPLPAPVRDTTRSATTRRRRRVPERLPGPVLRVAPAQVEAQAAGPQGAATDGGRAETLMAEAAMLAPIFESIRHAQSLQFVADSDNAEWRRLAVVADAIARQIADWDGTARTGES